MSSFSRYQIQRNINKLARIRTDLTDDGGSIRTYNAGIDSIISDFQSFVRSGNGTVVFKLKNYKEPYQDNDSHNINAKYYVQREINYLDALKRSSADSGGGGGR